MLRILIFVLITSILLFQNTLNNDIRITEHNMIPIIFINNINIALKGQFLKSYTGNL